MAQKLAPSVGIKPTTAESIDGSSTHSSSSNESMEDKPNPIKPLASLTEEDK